MPLALIVDDEKDTLFLFNEALSLSNFETVVAQNVEQALEILEQRTPDVALIDMNMPGRPGTDILEYINKTPRLANTRKIMITANALAENRAENLGADLFLVKPVGIRELITLVQRLSS